MKKFMLATAALVGLFLVSTGTLGTPAATAARPAASAARPAPQFGSCRWYCGSRSFTTRATCQAACPTDFCEQIC